MTSPLVGRDLRYLTSPTRYNGPLPTQRSVVGNGQTRNFGLPSALNEGSTIGGIGSAIIDLLSRGVYASAGFSKAIVKDIQGGSNRENPLSEAWKGLSGQEKETYSDVISQIDPDAPEWVKFTGGLAGDIFLDPANLLLGGVGAAARAGIKATQAGKIAAKEAEFAANAAAKPLTGAAAKAVPAVSLKNRSDVVLPILSINRRAGIESNARLAKIIDPIRQRFTPGFGFEEERDILRSGSNMGESLASLFQKQYLNKIAKTHSTDNINNGYSAYKRQVVPKDPDDLAAFNDLATGILKYADPNDQELVRLLSTQEGVNSLNTAYKNKGIPFHLDTKKAMSLPRGVGNTAQRSVIDPHMLIKQMRDWDVKNPLSHMDQMFQATVQAKTLQKFADDFVSKFGKTKPLPGHSRMKDLGGSTLGNHMLVAMGGKPYYFPTEIANRATRIHQFLEAPTNLKDASTSLGKFIHKYVVPIMNIWKPYMTIARPGHHTRNLYSDIIITAMDGITSPGVYLKAWKTLKTGGALKKTGIQGLNEIESNVARSGADKLSTVRLRGRNEDVSADRTYKAAFNEGILPSHRVTEDFIEPGGKKTPTQKLLLDNSYMRGMGWVAEQTNHYTRMAHFIGLMEDKKFTRQFNTYDEVAHAAAIRVKKNHPDPTGLTPFEQKNMRVIFPFYSWTRQTLPAVMNAIISHPGKVTGLNKIGYEASKALGMNPNSIGDPFPGDQIYPSFVHDNLIGPIAETGWGQLGATTGSPQESILGDILNSSPQSTLGGNINPIARGIIESISGVNLQSGTKTQNVPERIDQQIPVINYIAKASGYSPTSLISNLIQGFPEGQILTENQAVKRGSYNPALTGINWLTGAGISDFNSKTFKNIAKQEQGQ